MGIFSKKWKSSNGEKVHFIKKGKIFVSDASGVGGIIHKLEYWFTENEENASEFLNQKKVKRLKYYVIVFVNNGQDQTKYAEMFSGDRQHSTDRLEPFLSAQVQKARFDYFGHN